ncbi:MAG: D-alanine--D-alanine ligase [Oscillospiraceae bacterium]|nr:D-alanine--D-alanine ligase [Oscillospiraceae bacterium]
MGKIKVAVLFGGMSNEHDISLRTAENIISAIPSDKYDVIPIGITKKGRWLFYPGSPNRIKSGKWDSHPDCAPAVILPDAMYKGIVKISSGEYSIDKIDAVIPALHGRNGEDGRIQGLLELSGIPYVGSGCLSSAACFDKAVTHTILEANGIKMAKWRQVERGDLNRFEPICEKIGEELGFPLFIKPANSGSSLGTNKAFSHDELKNAVKLAFSHDKKVVVEEFIKGRELECSVFGGENPFSSDVGEIIPCNEFYDYEAKYIKGSSEIIIPAKVDSKASSQIRDTAVEAFKIMGCQGLARVDFFLAENGDIILNEINTFPGFTHISMYPKLMEHMGISQSELLDRLITLCLESY